MATAVIMPKLGNTVESTIIVEWKKQVGDDVAEGDILCDVETDKAVMEVPSTVAGTLLVLLADAGDEGAIAELEADPLAAPDGDSVGATRLPLGPFLAAACIEALWLGPHLDAWVDAAF